MLPRRALALALVTLACTPDASAPAAGGPWQSTRTDDAWWLDVLNTSDGHRWVVGGTPTAGRILHDDGAGFRVEDPGVAVPLLNWITEDARGALVAVGNGGTILRRADGVWAQEPSPTAQDLWGVHPLSGSDAIAVGGTGREDGVATVLRRTGGAWIAEPLPALTRPNVHAFFKVWASSPADVWVVGQNGAVLHHDGAAWEERHTGTGQDLIAVWGASPDRVVMVGGRGNGVVVFWDGAAFTAVDVAPIGGLNGVWMRQRDVAHAVGAFGTTLVLDVATATVRSEVTLDTDHDLHAVNGDAAGRLTAVGGNLGFVAGPYAGSVFERTLGDAE